MGEAKDVARVVNRQVREAVRPVKYSIRWLKCLLALHAKMPFDEGLSGVS